METADSAGECRPMSQWAFEGVGLGVVLRLRVWEAWVLDGTGVSLPLQESCVRAGEFDRVGRAVSRVGEIVPFLSLNG